MVSLLSRKYLKSLLSDFVFYDYNVLNSILAGALSQTPLEKLTALPQVSWLNLGVLLLRGERRFKRGENKKKGKEKDSEEKG